MNDRIKVLEKQCWSYYVDGVLLDGQFWSYYVDGVLIDGQLHFDTKKFAELIIKECADIALREDHDPSDCILNHFGVER